MTETGGHPWTSLLPPPPPGEPVLRFPGWLVRRHGEPLLWLPADPLLARCTLDLYPAQSRRARWSRLVLHWALGLGWPLGLPRADLEVDPQAPFLRVLRTASVPDAPVRFGILCGNPKAAGRRFVFLRFDAQNRAEAVIKAGADPAARQRWEHEVRLLGTGSCHRLCSPPLLEVWEQPPLFALVQTYVPGRAPRRKELPQLPHLLVSWLDLGRKVPLGTLRPWTRLQALLETRCQKLAWIDSLAKEPVHPAIFHGDFAPWNVRVESGRGRWWVVDWERGQWAGPPGWDWAYYLAQEALLVRRWRADRVLRLLEEWWDGMPARHYFRRAGAEAIRKPLVAAGLLYHYMEWCPTEAAQSWQELVDAVLTHPAVSSWPCGP